MIIEERSIVDLSEYPVYSYLVDTVEGDTQWKPEFEYLEEVNMFALTYLSDELKVRGFVVEPTGDGPFPCIILNRGGNKELGAWNVGGIAMFVAKFAAAGYVVVAPQYRGNGGGEGIEEFGDSDVNDVVVLPKVLAELPKADTSRIGMFGWSRGGMMSYIALR